MKARTDPLAADMYEEINFKGGFLKQRLTRQLLKEEQYMPSGVIDRGSLRTWQDAGATDTFTRAKTQLQDLLNKYQPPDLPSEKVDELKGLVAGLASDVGLEKLPVLTRE